MVIRPRNARANLRWERDPEGKHSPARPPFLVPRTGDIVNKTARAEPQSPNSERHDLKHWKRGGFDV